MAEVKQCIICGVKGEVTEEGPCRHLRRGATPRYKCQLPICKKMVPNTPPHVCGAATVGGTV